MQEFKDLFFSCYGLLKTSDSEGICLDSFWKEQENKKQKNTDRLQYLQSTQFHSQLVTLHSSVKEYAGSVFNTCSTRHFQTNRGSLYMPLSYSMLWW